jgi:pyruvate/2-oxoacid:ferredoxin oxidoreductase alpha subunit
VKKVIMGNHALSYGAMLARAQVIPAYPITPQTEVVGFLSELCADKLLDAKFIKVESEHSAMAAAIGASAVGARAFTATSAQGLALMHEMLHWAVGARLPIVMGNINRAMGPPWTIWTDQNDSLSQRDTGMIQVYCESNQEVLDTVIQAYKVAENEDVLLPVMIVLDAFVLSHTSEVVDMPDQELVDEFLPPRKATYKIDPREPHSFGNLTTPDRYMELRYKIERSIHRAESLIREVDEEFGETFGRSYGLIENYQIEDAETIVVASATVAGTAHTVIDQLRAKGEKYGLVRVRLFRPFPLDDIREALKNAKKVIVIDRNISFGHSGIFYQEVKAAMYNEDQRPPIFGYIAGLGGRDVTPAVIMEIIEDAKGKAKPTKDINWIGLNR